MSYKWTSGSVRRGDIYAQEDTTGDATWIEWGQDTITFRPGNDDTMFLEVDKVGIGTTSPDHTLHVTSPGTCHIKIESEAGYESALKLSQDGQSSAYVWMPGGTDDLRFYLDGADVMHLDSDGNVGIGTTTPAATLHVDGDISGSGDILLNNTQGVKIRATGGHQGRVMDLDDANNLNIGTWTGSDIRLSVNGSDVRPKEAADISVLIDGAAAREGNVGIGTGTEAYSRLSISGSVAFNVTVFTASDTLDVTHHVAVADCNAADVTLTLPEATNAITGRQYIIKRADSSNSNAHAFVIAPGSGDDIDGADSNITDIGDGTSHTLICVGSSGRIIVDKYVGGEPPP